jgi:basic membrane lipoprotein Med (substrate-binding protein (PBP1-ABC) superfamily)
VKNIPASLIVGTAYAGRTNSFAANFMPLLDSDSEFAKKWSALSQAHLEEGIREPIKVYEYMYHFYVVEGNKRVSVLKYFDAASIPAVVTRKVPAKTDDPQVQLYYEFMDFYEKTTIYRCIFSKTGSYERLLKLLPVEDGKWNSDFRQDFLSVYYRFETAYEKSEEKELDLTASDIFLKMVEKFGYSELDEMSSREMGVCLSTIKKELLLEETQKVEISLDPKEAAPSRNIFNMFFSPSVSKLKIAFVHGKAVEQSGWVYSHELGRSHLENVFGDRVETEKFFVSSTVSAEEQYQELEKITEQGYNVIFTTTPELAEASLRIAVEQENVNVLNCSINLPHKYVRTYYSRLYEAKFIMGAVAAALSEGNDIGYIADYPIYGMIANINAFAIGAKMINPKSRVFLGWDTVKDANISKFFESREITMVSNRDILAPGSHGRQFGLCMNHDGRILNLAMPVTNWGVIYEKIVRNMLSGTYRQEGRKDSDLALNYWWGMSAGAIDVFYSHRIPKETRKLISLLKGSIRSQDFSPFCGKFEDNHGNFHGVEGALMSPDELMKMGWLIKNVEGEIPTLDMLKDEAKPIVSLQGILNTEKTSE